MSGGFFDYENNKINDWADMIFTAKEIEEKQLSQMLRDMGLVLHDYDYWKCGDCSKEKFIKSWANFLHKYQIKFTEKNHD